MSSVLRLFARKPTPPLRDTLTVPLPGGRVVDVLRVRDPRARRLKLSVDERGARLSLPLRASLVSGDRFLAEHREWLALQCERFAASAPPPLRRGATDVLPLRDALLPVQWREGRFTRLLREGDTLAFSTTARAGDAALRRAARDFYEAEARADIARWMPGYLPGLPRAPSRIALKRMSSQWGSLSAGGVLALDLSLVLARPQAFEYVLVHELCHLVRADHSRAFWREVEGRFPAWRQQRDYFHAEGRRLKATLRALTG